MSAPQPTDRLAQGHAAAAADHLLAIVAARDPQYPLTAETHDAAAALVIALAAALAAAAMSAR